MCDGDVKAKPELMAGLLEDIQHDRAPGFELYDLRTDPAETHNLANDADHRAVFSQLKAELYAWMTATDDPLLHGYATPHIYHDTMNALSASSTP